MNPKNKKSVLPQWYYWVLVPFSALVYTVFCWWFALEAWGYRGEIKPWWFDIAFILTAPSMLFPSYIGTLLWGGLMGFGIIQLVQWIRRVYYHLFEKKEQGRE
ncbi:MAG: hypothetical protein HY869_10095 [Chloroflexi bacterium]|nr:hypothetical protein [Chloroflexota bacterium]